MRTLGAFTCLLVLSWEGRGVAQRCGVEKLAEVRAPATPEALSVSIDCDLDLACGDVVTKYVLLEGAAASNHYVDCHGGTIRSGNDWWSVEIRSKEVSSGAWSRPENVTVRNCHIIGTVRVNGMYGEMDSDAIQAASRQPNYVRRIRSIAPTRITFDHVHFTSIGYTPLYLQMGVTRAAITNSLFDGVGKDADIYLEAESEGNVIRNNDFLRRSTNRETISVDGSSGNLIVGNRFWSLAGGGIYLYRNCGERGIVRHTTPSDNRIINNIFYYDRYTGSNPAVFVGSRDGGPRSYGSKHCGEDADFTGGSGGDNRSFARNNVVMQNQIYKRAVSEVILQGDPTASVPNRIADNETVSIAVDRQAGCYVPDAFDTDFLRHGEAVERGRDPNGRAVCSGVRQTCTNGVLSRSSTTSCGGVVQTLSCSVQAGDATYPARGFASGSPVAALSRFPSGRALDLWVADNDGNVYTAFYNDDGVPWNGWHELPRVPGGGRAGAVLTALARFPEGKGLDVFVAGKDGNVYTAFYNDDGVPWNGWHHVVGRVPSDVPSGSPIAALARYPDGKGLDVFVTGNDGNVYAAFYNDDGVPWNGWHHVADRVPHGLRAGAPVSALARYPDGRGIDLFVAGNDGRVYIASFNDAQPRWSRFHPVAAPIRGGVPAGAPITSIARYPDGHTIDLFVTASDGRVYTANYDDTAGAPWNGWHRVAGVVRGGLPAGAPVAALGRFPDGAGLDLFVTGNDGRVYTAYYNDAGVPWNGWHRVADAIPGGLRAGAPVTALARYPDGHALDLFVTGNDGHVYSAVHAEDGSACVGWRGWDRVVVSSRVEVCSPGRAR